MSTAIRVGTMSDPSDVVSYTAIFGTGGVAIMLLMRIWKEMFSNRAEIQMMKELQTLNADLRVRIEAKDVKIAALMEEKLTYQADLRTALDKIQILSNQINDLKDELTIIKNTVRGSS